MQKRMIAGAGALVALGLAAGSALTASNTVPDMVAGYGTAAVTGASVNNIDYTYSTDMSQITNARLVFTADQRANTVKAAFNTDTPTTCTVDASDTTGTVYNCDFSPAISVADNADTFHVSVTETVA